MLAAYIISLVLSIALSVDQMTAAGLAKNRNSKLTKAAAEITDKIVQDQALLTQLRDAYNRRDNELASAILQQSPFSSSFSKIRQAYNENKLKVRKIDEDIKQQQINASKSQGEINRKLDKSQTSGSAIVDLISGTATMDTTTPKYDSIGGNYESKQK